MTASPSRLHTLVMAAAFGLLWFAPSPLAAQFGVTGGKSYSDVVTRVSCQPGGFNACGWSYPDRESFFVGATYRHRISGWLSAQPELLLTRKGWSTASDPTLTTTYLQLPVLLRVGAIGDDARVRPIALLGVSANARVSCTYSGGPACGERDWLFDHRVTRFDVGTLIGLGMELRLGQTLVALEGRVEQGLRDTFPGETGVNRNQALYVQMNVVPRR